MPATTVTSREFNQRISRAKRAAVDGPVVSTDRGQPAYVLLSHDAYRRLIGAGPGICELLDQPSVEAIEFDHPAMCRGVFRSPDVA